MPESIDIVLPCFNPNDTWMEELLAFHASITEFSPPNYIIVNDGSSHGNIEQQIKTLQQSGISLQFISYQLNKGKGYALRKGIQSSTADLILYTDIDFPFTNKSMKSLISVLQNQNVDIAVGYRSDSYYEKKMSRFRKLLSKAFRFFVKQILKMPVTDTQCGLKAFNKKGKEKFLATTINRYLFDFEFIYESCKDKSLTIQPVQVQLKENIIFSKMKLKIIFQETLNLIRILLFK